MPAPRRAGSTLVLAAYTVTVFLGATLLFLVEPMVTKMLLPLLGGTADVWNTAMVFFQTVLLLGYLFAHLTLSKLGVRRQPVVQLLFLLVPLALLPVAVPDGWVPPAGSSPIVWTLGVMAVMVGGPFLMLATAGPTLQRWFSATGHPHAGDPYFLYAAGNVGSLLALVSYPLLVERVLSLADQTRLWTIGYVTFLVGSGVCAVLLRRAPAEAAEPAVAADAVGTDGAPDEPEAPITTRTRLRWIALAAIPSSLLLGVTRHISTDVASMPLFWIIPLSLYLATFIVAFGARPAPWVRIAARVLKLLAVPLALSFFGISGSLVVSLGLHLAVFVCAALVAHGRLAGERPGPRRLTEFYLLMSFGGMVGGVLTSLVAPVVFSSVLEYPIALVLALAVLPMSAFTDTGTDPSADAADDADANDDDENEANDAGEPGADAEPATGGLLKRSTVPATSRRIEARQLVLAVGVAGLATAAVVIRSAGTQEALTISMFVAALGALLAYVLARDPRSFAASIAALLLVAVLLPANPTLFQERTFFGVHRVYEDKAEQGRHVLLSGTTVHGIENVRGPHAGRPTTYYDPTGPIGQVFEAATRADRPLRIGLIGLGTGALAAYGRPGDRMVYYEIDQAVVDIATDERLFTFVPRSPATVEFKLGDGRLVLEDDAEARYDLLVVDAFSGDSVPVHLLTDEALALYRQRLAPGGVIAFHISNRYFDFAPVLARLAANQQLAAAIQDDEQSTPEEEERGKLRATWVLMAATRQDLAPVTDRRWLELVDTGTAPLWTDDFSDLLGAFRLQD